MITATIKHSDEAREDRVNMSLKKKDGRFVWVASVEDEDEYDTDVTGETEQEAIDNASIAWGSHVWDLQISE